MVHSFGVNWIRISGQIMSQCIKGTNEYILIIDSSSPLMQHGPGDLASTILIQISPNEYSLIIIIIIILF